MTKRPTRITIIGLSGSGKTTLAKQLAAELNIPRLEIDRIWFAHGGNRLKRTDLAGRERVRRAVHREVRKEVRKPAWVSDGTYPRVQDEIAGRAQVLIFMDIPLYHRIWRHVRRAFQGNRHAELRWWDEVTHVWTMIRKTSASKVKIASIAEKYRHKLRVVRSRQEVEELLAELTH